MYCNQTSVFQPIMAMFRCSPIHPQREVFNWAHFCVGQSAHILAGIVLHWMCIINVKPLTCWLWILQNLICFLHDLSCNKLLNCKIQVQQFGWVSTCKSPWCPAGANGLFFSSFAGMLLLKLFSRCAHITIGETVSLYTIKYASSPIPCQYCIDIVTLHS